VGHNVPLIKIRTYRLFSKHGEYTANDLIWISLCLATAHTSM